MANWQDELDELLRVLGVTAEEPGAHLQPSHHHQLALSPFTEQDILEHIAAAAEDEQELLEDLDDMRYEVDSIVRQVVRLIQRGGLEPSLKEDVMIVLRALRSRAMATRRAGNGEIASIESNAAILHFCRIILNLSETTIEE